jgi:hypothetical protein
MIFTCACAGVALIYTRAREKGIQMSKRHYIAIARSFKEQLNDVQRWYPVEDAYRNGAEDALLKLAVNLADYFQIENKNFKRQVFLEACGFTYENL